MKNYNKADPAPTMESGIEYVSRKYLENERDNFGKNRTNFLVWEFLMGGATIVLASFGHWDGAVATCGTGAICHHFFQQNKTSCKIMSEYLEKNPGDRVPLPAGTSGGPY